MTTSHLSSEEDDDDISDWLLPAGMKKLGDRLDDALISAEAERAIRAAAVEEGQNMNANEVQHLEKSEERVQSLRQSIQIASMNRSASSQQLLKTYREEVPAETARGDFLAMSDPRILLVHDLLTSAESAFYRKVSDNLANWYSLKNKSWWKLINVRKLKLNIQSEIIQTLMSLYK